MHSPNVVAVVAAAALAVLEVAAEPGWADLAGAEREWQALVSVALLLAVQASASEGRACIADMAVESVTGPWAQDGSVLAPEDGTAIDGGDGATRWAQLPSASVTTAGIRITTTASRGMALGG